MNRSPIDPTADPAWDSMLLGCPGATVFHTSAWARVLIDSYGFRPFYFATHAEGSGLKELLPVMEIRSRLTGVRGVSLPFSDSGHPFSTDAGGFSDLVSDALDFGRSRGWKYLELRGGGEYLSGLPCSVEYLEHVLRLDRPEDDIFRTFRTNMKRNIRKAANDGVSVEFSDSPESVAAYYRLHCITRKSHGLPPQPLSFFLKIREHLLAKGMGFVALARSGGDIVAGAVYLTFGEKMLYKFGASNNEGKRLRANNLVMWEAIRRGIQGGMKELSFGRTDKEQTGLLEYKRGFGTEEKPLRYYRHDVRTGSLLPSSSLGSNRLSGVFRRMPIPVSRFMGTLLYRHTG